MKLNPVEYDLVFTDAEGKEHRCTPASGDTMTVDVKIGPSPELALVIKGLRELLNYIGQDDQTSAAVDAAVDFIERLPSDG